MNASDALTIADAPESALQLELPKTIVRRQMNQAGNILLSGVEPLGEEEFFAEAPNGISAAWTMGHLACVMDLFTSWIEERDLVIPDTLHSIFNSLEIERPTKTKASSVDCTELPKPDIMLLFRNTQVRTLKLLDGFDVALWESRTPSHVPETLPTYGSIWQNLGVHTFWHLGELCGALPKFHNTHTLNTLAHYFYFRPARPTPRSGFFPTKTERG